MEAFRPLDAPESRLEELTLGPLRRMGGGFFLWTGLLLLVISWGLFAYSLQFREGLVVTGMRDRVSWGLYIAMFVFFIGASMAGTFVSSMLRITKAGWRTPVTRAAEMVTVAALMTAGLFIMMDLGRPDRVLNTIIYGRWESPMTWDIFGLTTYLIGSIIYLYAALIPDMAYCRDHLGEVQGPARRWFYDLLSLGWRGTPRQRSYLGLALGIMMIAILPVAVMMHTVTSWIFAMTLREPWDSALFGVYFVGGAVYSGLGIIIIMMAVLRRVYRLEGLLTPKHFIYLGYMMASFAVIMLYLNASEFVVHGYKMKGEAGIYLREMFVGSLANLYRVYFWGGVLLPIVLIALPATRTIPGLVAAAVLVNIGMFLERYFIVVGGLSVPLNPYPVPTYAPTWVEWSLMAAGIAIFILILTLLLKLVPGIAISEILEEHEEAPERGLAEARPGRGFSSAGTGRGIGGFGEEEEMGGRR